MFLVDVSEKVIVDKIVDRRPVYNSPNSDIIIIFLSDLAKYGHQHKLESRRNKWFLEISKFTYFLERSFFVFFFPDR